MTALMAFLAALLTTACRGGTVYDHYEHPPISGWEKTDTLTFDVVPVAADGTFREEIGLRTTGHYPFMGLCLVIEQKVLPSGVVRSDTLNCDLIDEDGYTKGKGVSHYQYRFHLTDLSLHEGDSLHISIHHNMKRDILPGISDVGVGLERL